MANYFPAGNVQAQFEQCVRPANAGNSDLDKIVQDSSAKTKGPRTDLFAHLREQVHTAC